MSTTYSLIFKCEKLNMLFTFTLVKKNKINKTQEVSLAIILQITSNICSFVNRHMETPNGCFSLLLFFKPFMFLSFMLLFVTMSMSLSSSEAYFILTDCCVCIIWTYVIEIGLANELFLLFL